LGKVTALVSVAAVPLVRIQSNGVSSNNVELFLAPSGGHFSNVLYG
jgi:hypothetical protein